MRSILCSIALMIAQLAAGGCIYMDVKSPLAYRAPTPADVDGTLGAEVDGEACAHAVLYLVGWGNGGYSAAVENAKAKHAAQLIADVRADVRVFNVLGVYQKRCTVVRGRVVQ